MKRYGNIFESIVTMDNLRLAHNMARKDKLFYKEVKMVDRKPDYYLKKIQEMLINKTYTVSPEDYTMFEKVDKGKLREIYKLDYFPHRIIQWAVMLQIQDIFLKTFVNRSYASIPNKGIHNALNILDRDLKNYDEVRYCYKFDIKKFYPSINQEILKKMQRKKFKDKELLWLLDLFIDSMGGKKGIPIGSLLSQWEGNFYLTYFDHWILEEKKIKYYHRYCDDIVILHHSKEFLHNLRKEIEEYLKVNLDLVIKENWQIFPTFVRGVDFVGYRHFGNYILLRKNTAKRFKRKMRRILKKCENGNLMSYYEWCSINSYRGWIMWCDGDNLTEKYIEPLIPYAKQYYEIKIKDKGNSKNKKNKYKSLRKTV